MTLKEKFLKKDGGLEFMVNEFQCVKIADEFAIGFAEWILKKCSYSGEDSNKGSKYYIKGLDGLALYYPATYTTKELLEIYKKEKGL